MSLEGDQIEKAIREIAYDLHALECDSLWLRTRLKPEARQAVLERLAASLKSQAISLVKLAENLEGKTWDFAPPSVMVDWR